MSEPIVFVSHFRVKEGKLDGLKQLVGELTKQMNDEKPGTLVYLPYLSEDGTEMTIVHAFADAESMNLHWEGADDRTSMAYEYLEPRGFEIYGKPSDEVLEGMRREATPGIDLTVQLENVGGFLRLA